MLDAAIEFEQDKELLIKAKAFIDQPYKWCQNNFVSGNRMCAVNAVHRAAYGENYLSMRAEDPDGTRARLVERLTGSKNKNSLCSVNNTGTHERLMAVFDKAIKEA